MAATRQIELIPSIRVKKIDFDNYNVNCTVKKSRLTDIMVYEDGTTRIVTHKSLRELQGRTIKIRFSGISRARMGEIVKVVKDDNSSVYVRAVEAPHKRAITYYDVLIKREE